MNITTLWNDALINDTLNIYQATSTVDESAHHIDGGKWLAFIAK